MAIFIVLYYHEYHAILHLVILLLNDHVNVENDRNAHLCTNDSARNSVIYYILNSYAIVRPPQNVRVAVALTPPLSTSLGYVV